MTFHSKKSLGLRRPKSATADEGRAKLHKGNVRFYPRKSLGQNFLHDHSFLRPLIEAAELTQADTVLEIGPGFGVLTQQLAGHVKLVLAVEKDFRLLEPLRRKFKNIKNIKIVHDDILKFDLAALPKGYKIVANLPFNITSPVIRKLIDGPHTSPPLRQGYAGRARLRVASRPSLAVLTVQKEVGERLTAPPGDSARGMVTVFLERYAPTRLVSVIPKTAFDPMPGFDAAVIKLTPNQEPADKLFERVVKAGFVSKRRQVHNSLAGSLKMPSDQIFAILKQANVEPKKRAEDLTLRDWQALSRAFRLRQGFGGQVAQRIL